MDTKQHIDLSHEYCAPNYHPLDVVVESGQGAWVTDVEGKKYLDMLSAYSAVNFGHCNARFAAAAKQQLDKLTLTSRAFYNDQIGILSETLCKLCGCEMVLYMNSGAEAVETALKAARKWGYQIKGVEKDKANIVCFENNFAGRTITIISFSTSASAQEGFGPFTPGFRIAKYGDINALKEQIDANTVAVLVEPIQGEAGILIPPEGYLRQVRELCSANNVLMIADEIQTGLGRTGYVLACEHENVQADLYLLGKSLGGGIVPISAVLGKKSILQCLTAGTHGSTFGGNPFACAIAREVVAYINAEKPHIRARELGNYFVAGLKKLKTNKIAEIRARGLMIGVDIVPEFGKARPFCEALKSQGLLCKDTRQQTIRFAPPLIIEKSELDWGLEKIAQVLT